MLAHRDDTRLDDVDAFAGFLVVSERADAVERLRVLALGDDGAVTDDHVLEMPEPVYSAWLGGNPEYDATTVRYQYTSLVSPTSAYDYDPATRTATLVKRQPVPGYDPERYESRREWATAPDGTRVPISIVFRRDRRGDDPSPMLLYGYGSYEVSIDPTFSASRVSLLDRGVVFAIAHVRGGGELGRRWYDDGKLLHKTNTFTDFVACAEHLVQRGLDVTRPARGTRRQRRRPAHGRGGQPASRPLPRHRRRGAVRRLPHHDPRREPARSPSPSGRSGATRCTTRRSTTS